MSTNFYFRTAETNPESQGLHIGKSSAGWTFALHGIEELGLNELSDWVAYLESNEGTIADEYGTELTLSELMEKIVKRSWYLGLDSAPYPYDSWEEFHSQNMSMNGPNGLVRIDPAKASCKVVTPEDSAATYDICFYEFF